MHCDRQYWNYGEIKDYAFVWGRLDAFERNRSFLRGIFSSAWMKSILNCWLAVSSRGQIQRRQTARNATARVASLLRSMQAIVISSSCPGVDGGHAIALKSALEAYETNFSTIDYVVFIEVPVDLDLLGKFQRTRFHFLHTKRASLPTRFLQSLLSAGPACTAQIGEASFRRRSPVADPHQRRQLRLEIIIFEHVAAGSLMPLARRLFPAALVVTRSHDVLHRAFSGLGTGANLGMRIAWDYETMRVRTLEATVLKESDLVWCITADDAESYVRDFSRTADGVFSTYIVPMRYQHVAAGNAKTVIHLGGLDARREHGLRRFIEHGWPKVLASVPDAHLIFGGRGSEKLESAQNNICGLGYVQDELKFFDLGQIFLNPQLSGAGIKIKNLNALAAGKTLVTTPVGAQGIGFAEGTHFLLGSSPEELASQIIRAMSDRQLAANVAENGRSFVINGFSRSGFLKSASGVICDAIAKTRIKARSCQAAAQDAALIFLFCSVLSLILSGGTACAQSSGNQIEPENRGAADLEVIRGRLIAEYSKASKSDAEHYLQTQDRDGSWRDINYLDRSAASWKPARHLSRLEEMAVAYQCDESSVHHSTNLLQGIEHGLEFWYSGKPASSNWWWNDIGQQQTLAKILILLQEDLPLQMVQSATNYFYPQHINPLDKTGENMVWYASDRIFGGLLRANASDIILGVKAMTDVVDTNNEEGIQPDFSFHQHGAQLYNAGYGAAFLADTTFWAKIMRNTPFAFPPGKVQLLSDYLLYGSRIMTRGTVMDFSALGRGISRPKLEPDVREFEDRL